MPNPKTLEDTQKIVMAGMKLLYSKDTRKLLDGMLSAKQIDAKALGLNISGLMKILWEKSGGNMPPAAIAPAAIILTYELASFLRDAGVKVAPEAVQEAAQKCVQFLRTVFSKLKAGGQPQQPQQPPQQQQPGMIGAALQGA